MPVLRTANVNGITYGELATSVLRKHIAFAVNSTRIDVVTDGHNKTEIICLSVQLWSENIILLTREPESFFVISENKCYEISRNGMNIVSALESSLRRSRNKNNASCKTCK